MAPGQKNGNVELTEATIVVYLIDYNKMITGGHYYLWIRSLFLVAKSI